MILFLFFLFLFVPVIEIAVFIRVGGWLGLWPTLGIVVFTAVLGTALFRIQGLAVLHQARASLMQRVFPAREAFDGLCLLLAGAFLIAPGFVTDGFGLLLFLPPFRAFLGRLMASHLTEGGWTVERPGGAAAGGETVIEGVYREVRTTPPHPPSAPPGRLNGG